MEGSSLFTYGFLETATKNNYEQVLFIIALCGIFSLQEWKRAFAVQFTLFIGYFLTMILMSWKSIDYGPSMAALVTPVAILIIALGNFSYRKNVFSNRHPTQKYRYFLSLIFGILFGVLFFQRGSHIVGSESIFVKTLEYGLGIILAHLTVLITTLTLSTAIIYLFGVKSREWLLIITGAVTGVAIINLIG